MRDLVILAFGIVVGIDIMAVIAVLLHEKE